MIRTEEFKQTIKKTRFNEIIGQETVKEQLRSALISGRHVILVGPPGCGKTTLVKNLAKELPPITVNDCGYHCSPENPKCPSCLAGKTNNKITLKGEERFIRVQGSPDLTAEDLLGDIDPIKALKYGPLSPEAFKPGKIFKANNGILFFDEVNRASERLQNALLQVLEEGHATIGGYDIEFPADFIFIGTMNPDDNSTEPLSDVFLDRFDIIRVNYPETKELEKEIITKKGQKLVTVPETITNAIIEYIRSLREDERLEKIPSVRASLGLYDRAQSMAYLQGKKEVSFEDVGKVIESVLNHRIRLKPGISYLTPPEEFIKQTFNDFLKKLPGDGR